MDLRPIPRTRFSPAIFRLAGFRFCSKKVWRWDRNVTLKSWAADRAARRTGVKLSDRGLSATASSRWRCSFGRSCDFLNTKAVTESTESTEDSEKDN